MPFLIALCLFAQDPLSADERTRQALVRQLGHPGSVDAALLAAGRSSSSFGTRYAALLVQIEIALTTGERCEAAWQAAASMSPEGGPKGAAEHLRALAQSFKAAAYCKACTNGKVVCRQCAGKKRVELKCHVCEGKGRVGAPGAVDKTAVTMKCRNCDGKALFRDVRCPGCSGTGTNDCAGCLGAPWGGRPCNVKECRSGRVPCPPCRGRGRVEVPCATCGGKGRLGAPGAIDPTQVTMRCNDCDAKGVLKEKSPCPNCDGGAAGLGWIRCEACASGKERRAAAAIGDVFESEPCGPCDSSGRREGKPCARCLGLGLRVKPASDPAKLLE